MSTWILRTPDRGAGTPGPRLAVKDNFDVAGLPTTNGSRRPAAVAATDAACLPRSGARIVGKANLHELAFGVTGLNPWFGTPVNPLDAALVPGGSSSGCAVAVATGEADVALGTDTGGSIRIPAACCGIVGLKTSRGRVPLAGVRPLAPSLDTVGPMAATVAGVAAGMTLLEPGFRPAPAPAERIGRLRLPAADWIDAAIDAALGAAGISLVDVALPGWSAATTAAMTILSAEAWEVHGELWAADAGSLGPDVAARLEMSSLVTAPEVAAAWEQGRAWARELAGALASVPLIALPVLADAPPALSAATRLTEIRYVAPFNLAGCPALALPVATAGRRVPASLQLVGPVGSEELLVATGALLA